MKKRIWATLVIACTLLLQSQMVAFGANTVFMVPEISTTWDPPGMIYKNPNLDSLAYETWYGLVADIVSNRGVEAALADLNANVSPTAYKDSILGIYPEGDVLSDAVMKMILEAGWGRIEIYYPTFFLAGYSTGIGMDPTIEKTENEDINQLLTASGYTNQVATIKVEGVTIAEFGSILYEPDFSFLRDGACIMYKYIPDIRKFVPGPTAIYDGYNRGFLDMENLSVVDGNMNGTYVVVTQDLPADLVITREEIEPLREQLKVDETPIPEEGQEMIIVDQDEQVKWVFADGTTPENFTPEATVEITSDKNIKVDFAFSGKLPEGTRVTIELPKEENEYKDGTTLYFYYYNPDTEAYEYVSEGIAQNGEVSFDIQHCSEYLITAEDLETVILTGNGSNHRGIVIGGVVALCAVGAAVTYLIIKKKQVGR